MFEKLKSLGRELKTQLKVYQLLLKDPRTPALAKLLLWLAVGYALLPFDVFPDFVPVVGHLDDLVIVPALVILALKMVPREALDDCRLKARGRLPRSD